MSGGRRLRVDLPVLRQTGAGLQDLAEGLQHVLASTSRTLRDARGASGHDPLARALGELAAELSHAGTETVQALSTLGAQVRLAAAAYREADVALDAAVPEVLS